jgi:hypothetical protein
MLGNFDQRNNAFAHHNCSFDNDKFIVFDWRCCVLSNEFFGTAGARKLKNILDSCTLFY